MYPKNLEEISGAPKQLYMMGNTTCLEQPIVAIIGARNCSEKGKKLGFQFAMQLAVQGITIASGMALRN